MSEVHASPGKAARLQFVVVAACTVIVDQGTLRVDRGRGSRLSRHYRGALRRHKYQNKSANDGSPNRLHHGLLAGKFTENYKPNGARTHVGAKYPALRAVL